MTNIQIGTVVRVVHEDSSHHAKIGDVGTVIDFFSDELFIVEFYDKEFPNGSNVQALEMHDVEVIE